MQIKIEKPKIGEPCNNCGLCCNFVMCNTGAYLMKKTKYFGEKSIAGPCPALVPKEDGRFLCGLIVNPKKYIGKSKYRDEVISKNVAFLIGSGTGCDEIGYDEDNEEENAKLDAMIDKIKNDAERMEWIQKSYTIIEKIRNGN